MTDYSDGLWHGWNGGERPVHPQSVIAVRFRDRKEEGDNCDGSCAAIWDWAHYNFQCDIIAFRVIKPYVEPREFWINEYSDGFTSAHGSEQRARVAKGENKTFIRTIHVREVQK